MVCKMFVRIKALVMVQSERLMLSFLFWDILMQMRNKTIPNADARGASLVALSHLERAYICQHVAPSAQQHLYPVVNITHYAM